MLRTNNVMNTVEHPFDPSALEAEAGGFCEGQGQPVLTTKRKGGVGGGEKGEREGKEKREKQKIQQPKRTIKVIIVFTSFMNSGMPKSLLF